jgi:maleylpyruvate isomerase
MHRRDVTPQHVATETDRLLATVGRLSDADLADPSLCEGWTRGHVLAHLARNADALVRVASVATTGVADTMYDSPEARDADIAAGAGRPVAAQADDLRASAARLAAVLGQLTPEHGGVRVHRTPGGPEIPVGAVAYLRLRELVFHHVDLDAGFGFADAPPEVVALLLDDAVARLTDAPGGAAAPDVTVVTDEGDEHVLGSGATRVSGPRAGVLLWLARGRTDGVTVDGPLPTLPFGG